MAKTQFKIKHAMNLTYVVSSLWPVLNTQHAVVTITLLVPLTPSTAAAQLSNPGVNKSQKSPSKSCSWWALSWRLATTRHRGISQLTETLRSTPTPSLLQINWGSRKDAPHSKGGKGGKSRRLLPYIHSISQPTSL